MKVSHLDVYHVRLPLIEPWRTAYGSDNAVGSVLVRMTGEGGEGWGESTPLSEPTYGPEYAAGVYRAVCDVMAPALQGHALDEPGDVGRTLAAFKGNAFAKGALDLAWWDLGARLAGEPLWRLIGGRSNTAQAGAAIGVADSIDDLLASVQRAVDRGFARVKLKFSHEWGLPVVSAVRRAFPKLTMHVDCNSSFTLHEVDVFRQLDELNLAMIEQPLAYDDLVDHASLQRMIRTPICLDESVSSLDKARKAIELKACRWINIKPGRVGGLTAALRIHDLCVKHGLGCWIGSMIESGLGQSCLAALATLPGVTYPCDLLDSTAFFRCDLVDQPLATNGPTFTLTDRPGLGLQPDEAKLAALTVEHERVNL